MRKYGGVLTKFNLKTETDSGSSLRGLVVMNLTNIYEDAGLILGLAHWVKDPECWEPVGVGCRLSSDPLLLWLWCRPAATAWIQLLAWECPYAVDVALKRKKKKKYHFNNRHHLPTFHSDV